jgi:quinol-cytochrome oxidoreductase complex cytochrome b subunit
MCLICLPQCLNTRPTNPSWYQLHHNHHDITALNVHLVRLSTQQLLVPDWYILQHAACSMYYAVLHAVTAELVRLCLVCLPL